MYILNWRGHINLRINRDSTRLVPPQKKVLGSHPTWICLFFHMQVGEIFICWILLALFLCSFDVGWGNPATKPSCNGSHPWNGRAAGVSAVGVNSQSVTERYPYARTQMGSQLELPSYWMRFPNTWISHKYLNSLWKKYLIRLKNSPQSVPHSAEDVRNDCPFWEKARNSAHLQLAQFLCRWRHGHLFLFVGLRGSAEELKLPSNNLWVTRRQLGPQATNTSWMLAIVKLPCLMVYE
jgi:hypothetical protein